LSRISSPVLLLLGLTLAAGPSSQAASPPSHAASAKKTGKAGAKAKANKGAKAGPRAGPAASAKGPKLGPRQRVGHLQKLDKAGAQQLRWTSDVSGLPAAVRKGNTLRRAGKVKIDLPGIEGRAPHAVRVEVAERVGKGDGPKLKLSLTDQTSGDNVTMAFHDEKGTLRIGVGKKSVVIRQNPDGSLQVGQKRCADPAAAFAAFEAALPRAMHLEPELLAAAFVVPSSAEAGDKMVWETVIRPLVVVFREFLIQMLGTAVEWLLGFFEFWYGALWIEAYCSVDPGSCEAFLAAHG
jgi:hypothetical protein